MRFISVRDLRSKTAQVWRQLDQERDLIVTSNGKPLAILSAVSPELLEKSLDAIRTARAMMAVDLMQQQSVERGLDRLTLDEINAEIEAVRKNRPA